MDPKPPMDIDEIFDFEDGRLLDEAAIAAVEEVYRIHRLLDLPLAVWRNERVTWITADGAELPPDDPRIPNSVRATS